MSDKPNASLASEESERGGNVDDDEPIEQQAGEGEKKPKGGSGKAPTQVHNCPSCGRDSTLSNEGTVLLNFVNFSMANGGEPPANPSGARKGLASKDAHAVVPQTILRPATKVALALFLADKGSSKDDAEFLTEPKNWQEFQKFYVSQMSSLMMRPPGDAEQNQFDKGMKEAALRLPSDMPLDTIKEAVKSLEVNGLKQGGDEGLLKSAQGVVTEAKQPPTKKQVENSMIAIVQSSSLGTGDIKKIEQPCNLSTTSGSQSLSGASTSMKQESTDQSSRTPQQVKLPESVLALATIQQQDKIIAALRTTPDAKPQAKTAGRLLDVVWDSTEEPPGRVRQTFAPDGTLMRHEKTTQDGKTQNLLKVSDFKPIEISLKKGDGWVKDAFEGIMGSPFTVGKQCAYCEKVQGELTFPDRVRLAEQNGMKPGEERDAFLSKKLSADLEKYAEPSSGGSALDEKHPARTVEQRLELYLNDWFGNVAEELKLRVVIEAKKAAVERDRQRLLEEQRQAKAQQKKDSPDEDEDEDEDATGNLFEMDF